MDAYSVEWTPSGKRHLAKLTEKVATADIEFNYGGLAEIGIGSVVSFTWN